MLPAKSNAQKKNYLIDSRSSRSRFILISAPKYKYQFLCVRCSYEISAVELTFKKEFNLNIFYNIFIIQKLIQKCLLA